MAKLFLTRTLVFGCLATTALCANLAHAKDPSLYFYPSEKWNVASSTSGDAACTISSEFNNGYVIQFAGNADSFTGINIDFRQDTFEKGKTYDVKLSVPGVAEATVPSLASQKNMIVGNLATHKEFSQALIKASVLDFEVEGNAFRFYMTGLEAALKDYQQCAGISPSEKEAEIALEDQKIPSRSPQKLTEKIEEESERIDVIPLPVEEKIDVTAPTSDEPDMQIQDAKVTDPKNESPAAKPLPDLEPADDKPTSLQQKMAALAAMDSGNDKPAKNKKPTEPPLSKKEEPVATKEIPEAAPLKPAPKIKTIKTPQPKITKQPPVKMEADFTKFDEEPQIVPKEKRRELPPLKEAGNIEPAAIQPVDSFVDLRNKIKELEQKVLGLKDENASLEDDLKEALNDSREERLSVSSDNWNLERATMRFNEAERQIERLGRQLQTQKTQCDLEKRELEGMLFDPQVTNQQQLAKLASLEADLEQAKADLLVQQRTYEERIKLLEERLGK